MGCMLGGYGTEMLYGYYLPVEYVVKIYGISIDNLRYFGVVGLWVL